MILARRAPVRPRVSSSSDGVVLPLEDEVLSFVAAGSRGAIRLLGGSGAGKTTALEHLMAVLPSDANVRLMDEPTVERVEQAASHHLVVYATASDQRRLAMAAYRLAPWGDDDLIEYLLAVHKDCCGSVMARLSAEDRTLFRGVPELWRIALDLLATHPEIPDARSALRRFVETHCATTDQMERARTVALEVLTVTPQGQSWTVARLEQKGLSHSLALGLRHSPLQLVLAAEGIAQDLRRNVTPECLTLRLPRELVRAVGQSVAEDQQVLSHLQTLLTGAWGCHAMVASILHAADIGWVPASDDPPRLTGAYLDGAVWIGVRLPGSELSRADLSQADLRQANLDGCRAQGTDLCRAQLDGASLKAFEGQTALLTHANMSAVQAENARFDVANLEGANLDDAVLLGAGFLVADLTSATFRRADLARADLSQAKIEGADFSDANLESAYLGGLRLREAACTGARFAKAKLMKCDLEGMDLPAADFEHADLEGALLTASTMPDANFANACLRSAGLADVNWERVCLRSADLRGASFHMGSTRSGLLITTIASEGTRTGFYTDDYDEQSFKEPEEIRKANLRGADLRGAQISDVDFYLVDLREALYDPEQEAHLRRCGAILEDRSA